jgi:hypothetical protein
MKWMFKCSPVVLSAGLAVSLLWTAATMPALCQGGPGMQPNGTASEAQTSAAQPSNQTKDVVAPTASATTPAAVVQTKPLATDNPPPKGMPEAMKLYNAGKYNLAQKEFEGFINAGVADDATHMNLAYCLYYQRRYTQSLKQFDWVDKNAKHHVTMQMTAQHTASALRDFMKGICPNPCLKPFDVRWQKDAKLGAGLFYKYITPDGGWKAFDENHKGGLVQMDHGLAIDSGDCPLCNGTGHVRALKDGDWPPRQ